MPERRPHADTAVILLGHGTTLNRDSETSVLEHAAALRGRGIFGEVRGALWKQPPHITDELASTRLPKVCIVPMFMSEGFFSREVIPRELGFMRNGQFVPAIEKNRQRLFYTPVIGTHPRLTSVVLSRAESVVRQFPFPRRPTAAEITLFIVGHGTGRNENSRRSVEDKAESIRAMRLYAEVQAVFMEEPPYVRDYVAICGTKFAVVVPFFISDGLHVREDIPVLMGEPLEAVKTRLDAGRPTWPNPREKRGVLTWYSASVGSAPELTDVVVQLVEKMEAQSVA